MIHTIIVASVSFTISEAAIFNWLRLKLKFRSKFFGKLISCGYCLGHWIAAVDVFVFKIKLDPLGYVLTILAMAWIAGFQWAIMCWLFKIAGK